MLSGKSDLVSEVLSEVFTKHLPLQSPDKHGRCRPKSEVVRSFCNFYFLKRTTYLLAVFNKIV